jgi:hypothetical protein
MNEFETNNKYQNFSDLYRGTNGFKKGYQPRTNLVKDENDDLLADYHNIMNRQKNYVYQLYTALMMLDTNAYS